MPNRTTETFNNPALNHAGWRFGHLDGGQWEQLAVLRRTGAPVYEVLKNWNVAPRELCGTCHADKVAGEWLEWAMNEKKIHDETSPRPPQAGGCCQ